MSGVTQPKVAVLGLGAQGIVTVKNLLEQDFEVLGIDRNDYVGGIWHYSAEHKLSALPTTVVNASRERGCFTDFPFPTGTNSFPNAAEMDAYLNAYCDEFKLRPHLLLGTSVKSIHRDESKNQWILDMQNVKSGATSQMTFDKLVLAVGPHSTPYWPDITNRELFKGDLTHSISFKDPEKYANKRVVVVGISNTAADTATSLIPHASKVFLSHRHGCHVLPRWLKDGSSIDHGLTYRLAQVADTLDAYTPYLSQLLLNTFMARTTTTEFGPPDPQWRIFPAPGVISQVPTVSDTLIPALRAGTLTSTREPARILPNGTDVELADGTILENIDAIVCCTGYDLDLSILGPNDPTLLPNGKHDSRYQPRLFQNIFSLQHPNSLAFVGISLVLLPAFLMADLSSMALAQLWSNKPASPSLPSQQKMDDWYRAHRAWVSLARRNAPSNKIVKLSVREGPWKEFVQAAAGTNVEKYLKYGSWEAWRFWWNNKELSKLLMDGVYSPHLYRLFESEGVGRKKWDGASRAIETVNADVKQRRSKAQAAEKK